MITGLKQKKRKFKSRIKLNHNIDTHFIAMEKRMFSHDLV